MKKLKISARLFLSIILFVIPLSLLLYYYTGEITKQIDFAKQEKLGSTYLRPLVRTLADVNSHQLLALRAKLGDSGARAQMDESRTKIEADFNAIQKVQDEIGADLQFTPEGLKARKRDSLTIPNLKQKWDAAVKSNTLENIAANHKSLTDDIRGMIAHAGDTSNLILDPDLDSYYVMDVVVGALPQGMGRYGDIAGTLTPWLAFNAGMDDTQRGQVSAFAAMVAESDVARAKGDMDTAYNEDANFYGSSPTLKSGTQKYLDNYGKTSEALNSTLASLVKDSASAPAAEVLKMAENAQTAATDFWFAATDEMDVLLDARIASFTHNRNMTFIESLGNIALAFAFFFYVTTGIKKPLVKLQNAMICIADGQLETLVPCLELRDELGDMARTLEIFKETALESRSMEGEKRKEIEREAARQKNVEALIENFRTKVGGLLRDVSRSAESMKMAGSSLVDSAEQTTSRMNDTTGAASEASSNVEAVAAASEELTAAINEISRQVLLSSDVTKEAVSKTHSADSTVQQLSESARKIGEIIGLISSIAEQINLLALNATIESARAGEAGKGFAVVASEVKTLATQTSKATEAIAAQINEVQHVTQDVVAVLSQIQSTISQVSNISSTIAAAVEEQGAATREIAVNIQNTSDRMHQVSGNMREVSTVATSTNDNARSVLQSVQDFTDQSDKLQQEVQSFLSDIAVA